MRGQESLWAWLGIAVVIEAVGAGCIAIAEDSQEWLALGYVVLALGGTFAFICVVGLGVTAGMLRYDHLRTKR